MSGILPRKLRRDLWRQRWQFLAVVVVIAIGISVYVAASDAYRNLQRSFDRAYAAQRLPDAVLSGTRAPEVQARAKTLPGAPLVDVRQQGDIGIRIKGHAFLGRAVGVPDGTQPAVARLALRSGTLPKPGEVVVEQHVADHYHLAPGDTLRLLSPDGWRTMRISGSALSTEYFWPARSRQELMTTPDNFGVVFATGSDVRTLLSQPVDQLLLYARHRSESAALTTQASRLARDNGLIFAARPDQPSYHALQEDVDSFGTFANLLPWMFLTAAVLGTYVLLSRLVTAQRAIIGTFAANGVPSQTLRRHYLTYGVAAGAAGAAPGLVGGYFIGGWFTTQYTDALGLPLHVTSLHPDSLVIGALAGILAAALAAWAPARAAARTSPAEAMRVSPPGVRGGLSLVERLFPPLRRVPARWRMTMRGIMRNRRRTVLTVIGVAASVSLVLVFAGLRDTVGEVFDQQYGTIQLEDGEVHTAPGATPTVLRELQRAPGIAAAEPFARYDVTLAAGAHRYQTLVMAMPRDTGMHTFVTPGGDTPLPRDGILLGEGARAMLGVDVGDTVTLTIGQTGQPLRERIAAFVDEAMNPVAYMSLEQLPRTLAASGALLKLQPGASEAVVSKRVTAMPGVVAYLSTTTVERAMRDAFTLYDTLVGLMLLFAALMAMALLYNAMSANVAERSVELGTLRAAGMGSGMLGRLVATENLLLVVVGLPLGIGIGVLLADWFMSTYETQGYHWNLVMRSTTPLLVVAGVLGAAMLAQLPALRAIRRMDVATIVRERSL